MAKIEQRNGNWRAIVRIKNHHSTSKTFRYKREAEEWAGEKEKELRSLDGGSVVDYTVGEVLDLYHTDIAVKHKGYRWEQIRIDLLKRYLPIHKPLHKFTIIDAESLRDSRLREVSGASVSREMTIMSSVWQYAIRKLKCCQNNPWRAIDKPPSPPSRDLLYSQTQIAALLEAMKHKQGAVLRTKTQITALAFAFALETGMRAGEIVGAKKRYRTGRVLHIKNTKNGTDRNIPLSKLAGDYLDWCIDDDEYFFPIKSEVLSTMFRRHKQALGFDEMTFHDARHYAATHIAKKLSVMDLCKMFGWKDQKMALRYYNPRAEDIADMLD